MSAVELREKSVEELEEELLLTFRERFNLRMNKGNEDQRGHLMGVVRRKIARLKTIIHEKEQQT